MIFVNLSSLQKDKGKSFLKFLYENYNIRIRTNFIPIMKKTKTNKIYVKKKDNVDLNKFHYYTKKFVDMNVENFVDGLKEKILFKKE